MTSRFFFQKSAPKVEDDSESEGEEQEVVVREGGLIMISYDRKSSQTIMSEVRDKLKGLGYNVWMDIYDAPRGDALSVVSYRKTIKAAAVVVVGVCDGYKDSNMCRMQADYIYARNRKVIPISVQPNFSAGGWLGVLASKKEHIDSSAEEHFSTESANQLISILDSFGVTPATLLSNKNDDQTA